MGDGRRLLESRHFAPDHDVSGVESDARIASISRQGNEFDCSGIKFCCHPFRHRRDAFKKIPPAFYDAKSVKLGDNESAFLQTTVFAAE